MIKKLDASNFLLKIALIWQLKIDLIIQMIQIIEDEKCTLNKVFLGKLNFDFCQFIRNQ